MEAMKLVRAQAAPIVAIDFFFTEANLRSEYNDDNIAKIVKGAAYERTVVRINEFKARCEKTLDGLRQRVNQTESEFSSIVSRANSEKPGGGPSGLFLDRKDHNAVARHNEKVQKHNAQIDLHRRLVDQADRAKERYEDAVGKLNEKKAELEEQIRQKLEELKPALDQDILALLGKMQQLAYDNIRNKGNLFAGFLLIYVAKKAYVFLYDLINNTNDQRAATDIFRKLDDELDGMMSSSASSDAIKQGLHQAAQFLCSCYQTNAAFLKGIQDNLQRLPYQQCRESGAEIRRLLDLPLNTIFEYQHIIDPAKLAIIEEQVQTCKATLEQDVRSVDVFISQFIPNFDMIAVVKDNAHAELARMNETMLSVLSPVSKDIFFSLGIFDDEDQDRYMKKYKHWLQSTQREIEVSLNINLVDLVGTIVNTELLTKSTKSLLDTDQALLFLSNKNALAQKRNQLTEGIRTLDGIQQDINELPRQKSEDFTKKMNLYLNISLLPICNVGIIYPIFNMINQFRPAFTSKNLHYTELRKKFANKFTIFFYIHIALIVSIGIISLLTLTRFGSSWIEAPMRPILYILTFTYAISTLIMYLNGSHLKKL